MSTPTPVEGATSVLEVQTARDALVSVEDRTSVIEIPTDADVLVQDVPGRVDVVELYTGAIAGGPGPVGPQGDPGPVGAPGPQGEVGPFAPTFDQHFASPSLQWVIVHDLGVKPVVTIYDLDEQVVGATVETPDNSTVIVTFAVPMAGTARLKA